MFKQGNKYGRGRPIGSGDRQIAINAVFRVMDKYKDKFEKQLEIQAKRNILAFYSNYVAPLQPKNMEVEHSGGISGDFIIGFKGSANGFIEPRSEAAATTTTGEQVKEVSSSSAS